MLRSPCTRSLSSYLLSSLSVTVPVRCYGRYGLGGGKDKKQEKPSLYANRDYTKSIKKDTPPPPTKEKKEPKPKNPFLRSKPVYHHKKKPKQGSLPEPYKYTMFSKVWKDRETKKLIKYQAIEAHQKAKEEFKKQKTAVFTAQTLPAVMNPQQYALFFFFFFLIFPYSLICFYYSFFTVIPLTWMLITINNMQNCRINHSAKESTQINGSIQRGKDSRIGYWNCLCCFGWQTLLFWSTPSCIKYL